MQTERPTVGQLTSLITMLKDNEGISKHWDVTSDTFYCRLTNKTLPQYIYLRDLLDRKKYSKINKLFSEWNLPRRDTSLDSKDGGF